MSLLMTMLSSFFRDRTNIETFLGGPKKPAVHLFNRRAGGEGANCVDSDTFTVEGFADWSSNSRAKERIWIERMDRWRQVFYPALPLQVGCRPVGTPGRPCGSFALSVDLGWPTAAGNGRASAGCRGEESQQCRRKDRGRLLVRRWSLYSRRAFARRRRHAVTVPGGVSIWMHLRLESPCENGFEICSLPFGLW